MSNARSPREVCSTTIGTSGLFRIGSRSLIGRAVYEGLGGVLTSTAGSRASPSCSRVQPTGAAVTPGVQIFPGSRARPRDALVALLLGRPDRLARRRLLDRDRLRGLDHEVGRLAQPDLLAQQLVAAALAQAVEELLRVVLALAGPERLEQVVVGDLDALGVGDRGQGRLAPQRALGVGLTALKHRLASTLLHLQERLGVDAAVAEVVEEALQRLLGAGR